MRADTGYLFTFAYKWLHEPKAHTLSILDYPQKRRSDDSGLLKAAWNILAECDIAVTWYGSRFDEPFIRTRFLLAALPPLPPFRHLDLYWTARNRLKLGSNRLARVQDFLQLKDSKTPLNLSLWMLARDGSDRERKQALKTIDHHGLMDVYVLEQAYRKLLPLVPNHPNLSALMGGQGCPNCGSSRAKLEGRKIEGKKLKHRVRCLECQTPRVA